MRPYTKYIAPVVLGLMLSTASQGAGEPGEGEIGRTTEREVRVVISASFGKLAIAKGEPEKIVISKPLNVENPPPPQYDYSIRNRIGYLDISFDPSRVEEGRKKGSFKIGHFGGDWMLSFSDAIPISFDVELGVSKADFDLTGLHVKDFTLSTGASDVAITFESPNPEQMNEMNIECGVGKLTAHNLGNANFKRFRFEGGLGASTLDFSGALQNDVEVDIQVGLGVCTIYLPEDAGARIFYEKSIVSRIDYGNGIFASGENLYFSENYANASSRINMRIEAGLGSVKIRRR